MPKGTRAAAIQRRSPYPTTHTDVSGSAESRSGNRNAATWSAADDEILLAARAAGLNWLATASQHFPNKTANACRKRHERLVERRNHEDWNSRRLDNLAVQYMEMRREIWAPLAAIVGERWNVVEAKCMEKGLKNLQSIARIARRNSASDERTDTRGNEEDHEGDSGIGFSDAEMEAADNSSLPLSVESESLRAQQHAPTVSPEQQSAQMNTLSRPQPLPLYQPPASALARAPIASGRAHATSTLESSSTEQRREQEQRSRAPDDNGQRSVSIGSMLLHVSRPPS